MEPWNPNSFVRLGPEHDEFGIQRVFVQVQPTAKDDELWPAIGTAADQT